MNKIKRDIFLFQPANRTHKIFDQVIEQIRIAIVSGRFKPGDKVTSEKEPMSKFGGSEEILTSTLIV
ncbi:MAG: hypothetical protein A2026_01350 [Deltaproteobacteria bacterium RBG_19FT_COMBO_46_12]|nr:MAG: hypothetical protein A2026_01350 [Deltaproteobacteria bacterium RBG_19FT_COMBO_46_12]